MDNIPSTQEAQAPQHLINSPQQGMSYDTKTLIVILLLIFFFPAGVILMFVWMKWSFWVKILVLIPVLFGVMAILASIVLIAVNPKEKIQRAQCMQQCEEQGIDEKSQKSCTALCSITPEPSIEMIPLEETDTSLPDDRTN